jgi:hypothetical protein
MKKNILNEVNVIRQQMGLKQLNETELLEIELNEIDLIQSMKVGGKMQNMRYQN